MQRPGSAAEVQTAGLCGLQDGTAGESAEKKEI